ncbi:glycosyltransferase family 4 protein [Flavobacterium sp. xlx-214]|uniref:glycosyltransferase family 4 protein n=1 Tax=unclassified Flavobacterium TaxID=196869 RepID=UPI0013D1C082|nr:MULTISPECIES: glycosyltransferase family 4 protein [unclassified Flavobacterium]MBA5791430.1 glycosyltransferase family 4 protein [Flavobacterium sp. xlx-221]QMI83419.1 glycosyltransferase family 4 protein [Flavobacterium sp. xlx-214]
MKKVLIIAYYWPPAGGPGVQRWLKFVKYLPDYNIEPIVYVPENAEYPIIDEDLIKDVSPNIKIIKQPIKEPYKIASLFSKNKTKTISSGIIKEAKKQTFVDKLLLYIRGNFFIPDARVGWVKPSVAFLAKYIKKHPVDVIITTGPPHSMHLIGMELRKKFAVQWIADFRDPWTSIGYHKELKLTAKSAQKHKDLEHDVLNSADVVLTTSYTTKAEFEAITSKPIHVITNGYDVEPLAKPSLDKKFTISHIGSLLSKRNPRILWKALKEILKENESFKNDFQLQLIGKVSTEIIDTIKEFRLDEYVSLIGYVSHTQALQYQRSSQLLLLIEIDSYETIGIIPGKLFEYMAAERPILALGPEGSDVAKILKETNTGTYFSYDDLEEVKNSILDSYAKYQTGTLQSNGIGLQYFSRKKLTEKLADVINI